MRDLHTVFPTPDGVARAVCGASFYIGRGEILGLVGESGCGKSVTALSILGLVPTPGRIASGEVQFAGRSLIGLGSGALRALRGREIAGVFQEPASCLNPVLTCGEQVAEVLRVHAGLGRRQAAGRAIELLGRVHLPEPALQSKKYPHEMSGGMCQRVLLATALACTPKLLIADEPTTGLDVTIQAQLLDLMLELRAAAGMAILLITHDLRVVAQVADRVAVMYAGRVVEAGRVDDVFGSPQHPYTRALLDCQQGPETLRGRLRALPGTAPHPALLPDHCPFEPRCSFRVDRCTAADPSPRGVGPTHQIRCFVDLPRRSPPAPPPGGGGAGPAGAGDPGTPPGRRLDV